MPLPPLIGSGKIHPCPLGGQPHVSSALKLAQK
jgi:hypothetical protein